MNNWLWDFYAADFGKYGCGGIDGWVQVCEGCYDQPGKEFKVAVGFVFRAYKLSRMFTFVFYITVPVLCAPVQLYRDSMYFQ